MSNSISLIAILSLFTLLPFIIASGTCFIKFSIVFVIVRNALGLQQVPSNMTLNGVALLLSMFVMMPVGKEIYNNSQSVAHEIRNPLSSIKGLAKYFAERAPAGGEAHQLAQVMAKEADRLNRVVSELLELVKPTHLGNSLSVSPPCGPRTWS